MKGVPKRDGSGMGMRANAGRGGCKTPRMKPKGKRGLAAVKRLGRNYKTGNFKKIVEELMRKGYSKAKATRIAASIYWAKVKAHRGK